MSHARVEEVSDSDPDDMDPSDFDPAKDSIIYHKDMEGPSASRSNSSSTMPLRPPARLAAASSSPSPPLFPGPQQQMRRPTIAQGRDIPRSYLSLIHI